jgi:hypothetical protein
MPDSLKGSQYKLQHQQTCADFSLYLPGNKYSTNHPFIVSPGNVHSNPMQHTEKRIRIIRDKLSRIGIGEKNLNDEMILASYSINKFGQLCAVPKSDQQN